MSVRLLCLATILTLLAGAALAWEEGLVPRADGGPGTYEIRVEFLRDRDGFVVDGRRMLPGSQETYLASADVVALFRAVRYWDPALNRLTLKSVERRFVATAGSRLVDRDGAELLLPVPVLALDGDIWLPLTFVTDVMAPAVGEPVVWRRDEAVLRVGAARPNVTGLSVETGPRSTSLRIRCEEPLGWRALDPENGVVTVRIYGGVVDRRAVRLERARGLVNRVSARQRADHALVDVSISGLTHRSRARSGGDGRDIVLVLEESSTAALPGSDPRGELNMSAPDELAAGPREIRTVVIDPGHGGDDHGCVSAAGLREKDVALRVARRLKDALLTRGFRVEMTRDGDDDLGPDARAEIADRAGGDLYISLHANGWFDRQVRGVETHVLRPAGRVPDDGTVDEDGFVPWDRTQWRHLGASREFAELAQARLIERTAAQDRGVRRTSQRVLRGVDMPAVVVELGYLSSPGEADQLDARGYQQQLAEALALAAEDYRRALDARRAREAARAGDEEEPR